MIDGQLHVVGIFCAKYNKIGRYLEYTGYCS